jgi:hypothetical protein
MGAGLKSARRERDDTGKTVAALPPGVAATPQVAVSHLALRCLLQAVSVGRLLASRRRAATLHAMWRSWGPLGSEAAQWGQASSRSPAERTWPTRSRRCRGEPHRNRRQLEERRRSDSRPQASAVLCGGQRPAPPEPSGAGKWVKAGTALPESPSASSEQG